MTEHVHNLEAFLAGNCDATKAKYAAELANATAAWRKPLDLRYAESLVHFGKLERLYKLITRNGKVRGSKVWFRKSAEESAPLINQGSLQTGGSA